MASTTAHVSCLTNQLVRNRTIQRTAAVRRRQLIPPAFLFVAMLIQLFVRTSSVGAGYKLERMRGDALENDLKLRKLKLEFAMSTRPASLRDRATTELGMGQLTPQRVRRLAGG